MPWTTKSGSAWSDSKDETKGAEATEEHGEGNFRHGGPGGVSLQGREGQVGMGHPDHGSLRPACC